MRKTVLILYSVVGILMILIPSFQISKSYSEMLWPLTSIFGILIIIGAFLSYLEERESS